jgi:cyclophilin family peptidyl-prolyl cis-trans isomerase
MKNAIFILIVIFMAAQTGFSQTTSTSTAKPAPETKVLIKTSMGNITVKLYNDTPIHRDNFIKLVKSGWYNGSTFHRVIPKFMIQGGANKDGKDDPGYTLPAEFNPAHFHKKGALAAARQGDDVNPMKKSSGCQFYLVEGSVLSSATLDSYEKRYGVKYSAEQRQAYTTVGGAPWLDGGYTVFGEVISGLDVIGKIAAVPRDAADKPNTPVTMTMEIIQ